MSGIRGGELLAGNNLSDLRDPAAARVSLGVSLPASNGTDDTAVLNAALAAGAGKLIRGAAGENYKISAPLVVWSNTTLDMTGCTVTLIAGSNCNMLNNPAITPMRTGSADASVSAGSGTGMTVTSATAAFTTADIGKQIAVTSTTAGGASNAYGTITAVASATSATFTGFVLATQTGGRVQILGRDSNISIVGGTWARGSNSGTTTLDLHSLRLRRVDGLKITDIKATSSNGKFAIGVGDVTSFVAERIAFATASDGVHVDGPASGVTVRAISGTCGDDAVAFTATEGTGYVAYNDVMGDITDVLVDDVKVSSTASALKLTSGFGTKIRRFHARDITQLSASSRAAVAMGDDTGLLDLDEITFEGISGYAYANTGNIGTTRFIRVNHAADAVGRSAVVLNGTAATAIYLTECTLTNPAAYTGNNVLNLNGCTIPLVALSRCSVRSSGSYIVLATTSTNNITEMHLTDCSRDGVSASGGFVRGAAGVTLSRLYIANCDQTNASWIANLYGTTDIYANGINCNGGGGLLLGSAAVVTVYGDGIACASSNVTAGGVLRSKTLGFPVDVALLAKNDGDLAYNTNSASAPVGPVRSNGASWLGIRSASLQGFVVPPASMIAAPATAAWFQANGFLLNRFALTEPTTLRWINFRVGVQSGNIHVGVVAVSSTYGASPTDTATRVMHSGVIACPAAGNARVDCGATVLPPGEYAVFFWADNTTVTVPHGIASDHVASRATMTISAQAGGVPSSIGCYPTGRYLSGFTVEA